jgi:uncharacterized protein
MKKNIAICLRTLLLLSLLCPARRAAEVKSSTPGGWDHVKDKRILYFSKSAGFEHSVVKRASPDQLSHSERVLTQLGLEHGFHVTCTKDGSIFTPQNLANYDVFVFYTSGDLLTIGTDKTPAMDLKGKAALLEAVSKGKGFVALHPASDSFHFKPSTPGRDETFVAHGNKVDPYIAMLGGEFVRHGPQQVAKSIVVDPKFPGCEALNGSFKLLEEWYTSKDFAPDMHVILALDTKGMQGIDYQRAPFPSTWARLQGQGRVFYTALGHREDVWINPLFQNLLLGGIGWAARNVDADVSPNLNTAAPGYAQIQPEK